MIDEVGQLVFDGGSLGCRRRRRLAAAAAAAARAVSPQPKPPAPLCSEVDEEEAELVMYGG